jgi:hypothetical protein
MQQIADLFGRRRAGMNNPNEVKQPQEGKKLYAIRSNRDSESSIASSTSSRSKVVPI